MQPFVDTFHGGDERTLTVDTLEFAAERYVTLADEGKKRLDLKKSGPVEPKIKRVVGAIMKNALLEYDHTKGVVLNRSLKSALYHIQ